VVAAWWWRRRRERQRVQARAAELGLPLQEAGTPGGGPEEDKEPEAEAEGEETPNDCVVCLDKRPVFAVAECGHLCMCAGCCRRILEGQARCPVCDTAIARQPMRIYQP
jgi:hypothetical protein